MPKRHPAAEAESELLGVDLRKKFYGKRRGTYRLLFSIQDDVVTHHDVRRRLIEP